MKFANSFEQSLMNQLRHLKLRNALFLHQSPCIVAVGGNLERFNQVQCNSEQAFYCEDSRSSENFKSDHADGSNSSCQVGSVLNQRLCLNSGTDLGISRGGGRIFKKNVENFVDFFCRPTKLILRALPKHYKNPVLAKISAPQATFWKKKVEKGAFRHFLESFDQKIAFF